ncbi:MAG: sulfatase family protein [bacterium]|jgi:arylsulfatase A
MKRRDFVHAMGVMSAGLALGAGVVHPQDNAQLPNIVLILADDMGYGDLSCLNPNSKIHTPNMDRLAKEGIILTDAHSPSAVCTPTRYGILTGRYGWRTRLKSGVLWGWSPPLIEPDRLTLASLLKKKGYRTGCVGKWHLGLGWQSTQERTFSDKSDENGEHVDYSKPIKNGPIALGFDYFFGIPASLDMDPYVYIENDRVVAEPVEHVPRREYPGYYRAGPIAPGFSFEGVLPTITMKAQEFIIRENQNHSEQPFFLYFPLTAPHTPWVPNDYVKGKSEAGVYGDFVKEVDFSVGTILDTLERLGLAENTLVILTSDNGAHEAHIGKHNNGYSDANEKNFGHEANFIFRGQKADAWDGGHRVPFLARFPKRVPAGICSGETVCLTDFMATFAALVEEPLPDNAGEDSYNLLPALTGQKPDQPIREATVHHSMDGMFSIRKGDWKLIAGLGSGGFTQPKRIEPAEGEPEGQLYNLADDPGEEQNLYAEYPEMVRELDDLLERYKEQGYSRFVQ